MINDDFEENLDGGKLTFVAGNFTWVNSFFEMGKVNDHQWVTLIVIQCHGNQKFIGC